MRQRTLYDPYISFISGPYSYKERRFLEFLKPAIFLIKRYLFYLKSDPTPDFETEIIRFVFKNKLPRPQQQQTKYGSTNKFI